MKTAGLTLDTLNLSDPAGGAEIWEKVIRKVRGGLMPPVGMPHPEKAALAGLASFLESSIDKAAAARPTPGRPVLHRLNRAEYGNAIRDLLALEVDVTSLLPPDDSAYGFDNIGDVLGVSPALMERYLSAAWKISSLAVGNPKIRPAKETFRVRGDLSQDNHIEGLPIGTRGGILLRYHFPVDGEYVISPKLYRETVNIIRGLETPHDLEITFDGERILLARFGGGRGRKGELPQPDVGRRRTGKALPEAAHGEGGPARHGCRLREEKLGADGRAAAAVPARADRSDYPGRHSRAGQGHDRGTVQRHRIGRLAEPASDLHLHRRRLKTTARRARKRFCRRSPAAPIAGRSPTPSSTG